MNRNKLNSLINNKWNRLMLLQLYSLKTQGRGFTSLSSSRNHNIPPIALVGRNINTLQTQTPFDGIMMPNTMHVFLQVIRREVLIIIGKLTGLRTNETISKFTRRSYSGWQQLSWINSMFMQVFPYIQTSSAEPNGRLDGVNGFCRI